MATDKPNILFIMADQMSARALRHYGNRTTLTPNIDRLADEGVVFANCYCNLPMCAPSRASMMAGILPFAIDMYDNASEFHADIPTFAHYLRHLGYRVELSGKMHFVGPDQMHGFEKRHTTDIYPANFAWTVDWSKGREYRPTNLTMAPILEAGLAVRTMQMDYDDEVEHYSVQALYDLARYGADRPFMLTVSFTSPHHPYVIDEKYWGLYDHDAIEAPATPPLDPDAMDHLSRNLHYCQARHLYDLTVEDRRVARHAYYGMISYIDEKVGRILRTLEETGLADDTVVIFTADHGDMMGERGMWFKQHFFDWSGKVPFIVHAPSRWKPGQVTEAVSLVDLLPTFTDLASGGKFDGFVKPLDGASLLPALEGETSGMSDTVVAEFAADGSTGVSRMVRKGPWKLMWIEGVDTLLYNLDDDPEEVNDLFADPAHAGTRAELEEILFEGWDPLAYTDIIAENQQQRLFIHRTTGGDPDYVNLVREGDERRYVRNAGAADTKARARLPFVAPAQPSR